MDDDSFDTTWSQTYNLKKCTQILILSVKVLENPENDDDVRHTHIVYYHHVPCPMYDHHLDGFTIHAVLWSLFTQHYKT